MRVTSCCSCADRLLYAADCLNERMSAAVRSRLVARTVQPLLHELDVGGGATRHALCSAPTQLGGDGVQDPGHDDRVGREEVGVDQVGVLTLRGRQVAGDLSPHGGGGQQIQRVQACFLGGRLEMEAQEGRLDPGPRLGGGQHGAVGRAQLGASARGVVDKLEAVFGRALLDAHVPEEVGAHPVLRHRS